MLNEEVAKYRKLSGDNNPDTPISRIGGYLDGYERALKDRPTGEWKYNPDMDAYVCDQCGEPCAGYVMGKPRDRFCKWCGAKLEGE